MTTLLAIALAVLAGCGDDDDGVPPDAAAGHDAAVGRDAAADAAAAPDAGLDAAAEPDAALDAAAPDASVEDLGIELWGVDEQDRFVVFRSAAAGEPSDPVAITGLEAGEHVLAMDVRPATGDLLALGSTSRLYGLDPGTAIASVISVDPFVPPVAGAAFGLDVNPVVDRVRIVSDLQENLRVNPDTGASPVIDTPLSYDALDPNAGQTPHVTAAGYIHSFAGAADTVLYAIDTGLDVLVTIGQGAISPNTGICFTVGALGVDTDDRAALDVDPDDVAWAVLTPAGGDASALYTIDLTTGAASLEGSIGGDGPLRAFAIAPAP